MDNQIKNIWRKNYKIILIIIIIFGVFIILFIENILQLFNISISNVSFGEKISDIIIFVTAIIIFWYTKATHGMEKEMINQTELAQMPVLILYIRDIRDYMDNKAEDKEQKKYRRKFQDYIITVNRKSDDINYFLRVRNVGKGTAFNVEVEIKNSELKIEKYQSQFLAPEDDEQSIKISDLSDLSDLNNKIFIITCENANNKKDYFKYKIIDVDNKEVKFIEKGKIL